MIELIKELRARTSLGMTACKKALEEAGGDIDKAIEILQKQGLKKVDDLIIPLEGQVRASIVHEGSETDEFRTLHGILLELNCQTDFGARSELFEEAIEDLGWLRLSKEEKETILNTLAKQLGEKVVLRREHSVTLPKGTGLFVEYNHHSGNIAVLLPVFISPDASGEAFDKVDQFAQEVAMHIAASKPLGLKRESIDVELVAKKLASFQEEVKDKKPEMQGKIVDGKMNKWYAEVVLLEQESVVHPKKTIGSLIEALKKEVGEFSLGNFVRWERGEQYHEAPSDSH